MSKSRLEECVEEIKALFANPDRRAVHRQAQKILTQMASDKRVFEEIVRNNLSAPGFFSKVRNNPVIGFPIFQNKSFNMIANCWLPHPTRKMDLTHQSIHHHGKLLLTSASAFGAGYESILFKRGFSVEKPSGVTQLEVDKFYRNSPGNIEFVDSFSPHVVFYPDTISITYVLWSAEEVAITEGLKRLDFLRKHRMILKKALGALGLSSVLGLNKVEDLDFYVEGGRVHQLSERRQYGGGTSENFARNVFHILQKTGFDDGGFLKRVQAGLVGTESAVAAPWLEAWLAGRTIEDVFEPHHHFMDKVTLRRDDLMKCFPGLKS